MKLCPHCKAELDSDARFCLLCMTSLDEKEPIRPPIPKKRGWILLWIGLLVVGVGALAIAIATRKPPAEPPSPTGESITTTASTSKTQDPIADPEPIPEEVETISQTIDGIRYTFRPATKADHPTAIRLDNYYVLVGVEGTPSDGIYRIPSFLGEDTGSLVVAVADDAFANTQAASIDLGYNVRYVWGEAFGGYALTALHLHDDVYIDPAAFSGCDPQLTIHCPSYLENTEGELWSDLASSYGFQWQDAFY